MDGLWLTDHAIELHDLSAIARLLNWYGGSALQCGVGRGLL